MSKKIGVLYGMERSFPPAPVEEINRIGGGEVTAEPVKVGPVPQEFVPDYDVIVDRISQDVPFYRTFLKGAAARGCWSRVGNRPSRTWITWKKPFPRFTGHGTERGRSAGST